jgi:hypothetical protein
MNGEITHREYYGMQIFSPGNIPDGGDLSRLHEWGFAEAYWLDVPDAESYLLDAYALGLMHGLARGNYHWADQETAPRNKIARLIGDLIGGRDAATIRYHSWRYVDLLHEAWRLGAGEDRWIDRQDWRRSQAVADAYFSIAGGDGVRAGDDDSKRDLGRAVAMAFSAWGGEAIPDSLLERLAAWRISPTDWEEATDDLRNDVPERKAGALIKLLYVAYDLGHPVVPEEVATTDLLGSPGA